MASWHPAKCKGCGARATDGATISKRGWCVPCGDQAVRDAITAMSSKTGPHYDRWRANPNTKGRDTDEARTA